MQKFLSYDGCSSADSGNYIRLLHICCHFVISVKISDTQLEQSSYSRFDNLDLLYLSKLSQICSLHERRQTFSPGGGAKGGRARGRACGGRY